MQTVIVPSCKNKNKLISNAGNNRSVFLATTMSKLFEQYILSCISPFVATTDKQYVHIFTQTVLYSIYKDTQCLQLSWMHVRHLTELTTVC